MPYLVLREEESEEERPGGKPPPPPLPPGTNLRTTSKKQSKATWPAEAASSANMGHPQGWEQGEHHSTDPRTAENALIIYIYILLLHYVGIYLRFPRFSGFSVIFDRKITKYN